MVAPQNAQTNCVCKSVGCLLSSVGAVCWLMCAGNALRWL